MRFVSTAGRCPPASLSEALRRGAAPDGGLYVPDNWPKIALDTIDPEAPLADFAERLLRPFFANDPLESELPAICAETFDFPVPLVNVDPARMGLTALELFHGPSGAFKDFGARFLMGCFSRLGGEGELTVLAATSGDTGGAVGAAAAGRPSLRAVILYPRARVSPFQERQLTCWGANVDAVEVDGDFDDCQRLAKAAFAVAELCARHRLTSANSINIGRLLPQLAYAAWAAVRVWARTGRAPGFLVPSGNLGHGLAVLMGKAMGVPIGPVVLATNANRTLKEWSNTGRFVPRPSIATLANAMDVGNPSNFERLAALPAMDADLSVELVDDESIRSRIASEYRVKRYCWCPHSATAVEAWTRLPKVERSLRPWIAAATAHPYKFAEIIEPLIGLAVEPNAALAAILQRPLRKVRANASVDDLAALLGERASVA